MNIFYLVLLSNAIIYGILLFYFIYFSNKRDHLNNAISFFILTFIFSNIVFLLMLMNQETNLEFAVLAFITSLTIPLMIPLSLIPFYSFIVNIRKGQNKINYVNEKILKNKNNSRARKDLSRKLPHVYIFIGFFLLYFISYSSINVILGDISLMSPVNFEGIISYFKIFQEDHYIVNLVLLLGTFYFILFFFFYTICILSVINELCRKSEKLHFPLSTFSTLHLKEEEINGYGSYVYFSIGQMWSSFACPPLFFLSILSIGAIGDLMASQIGIRFGKHSLYWNKKKTWEGTIAGSLTSFLFCFFLIGLFWALLFCIIFLIIDVITSRPLKMSDNLLIPMSCSVIYLILQFILI